MSFTCVIFHPFSVPSKFLAFVVTLRIFMWFHGAGFREQLVWHKPGLLVLLVLGDFSQGAPSRKTTAHRDMDMMFWTSYIVERSNEIWKGEKEKYGTFIIAFFWREGGDGRGGWRGYLCSEHKSRESKFYPLLCTFNYLKNERLKFKLLSRPIRAIPLQ